MKLTIKYFASLREHLGTAQELVDIDAPELTVNALRAQLAARNVQTAEALRVGRPVRAAVNLETVDGAFGVHEDCEIAFFQPVTGG
jgi:molybdopterin synthase sulfur carrier subunit